MTTRTQKTPAAALAIVAAALSMAPVSTQSEAQIPTMPPASIPVSEAAAFAQYWVLIAEGKFDEASRGVGALVARYPRSVGALNLLVEVDIAKGGALAALTSYETWLASRELEEPGVLRRIARAVLYEWARQMGDTTSRTEALLVLAGDGDQDAAGVIAALRQTNTEAATRLAARMGDSAGIEIVAERVRRETGLKLRDLQALAESRSPRAVAVLAEILKDPLPENRAAAADALGQIGGVEAENALRPALNDPHGLVRISVSAALFRMGNFSGAGILREMAASEHASVRRTAAMHMASQPDEEWKNLVRSLLGDEDPTVRLDAALMLAPHDKAAAQPVLDALRNDANPAIREATQLAEADQSTASIPTLRGLMRRGDGVTRVRAAARVLALTR